MKLQRYDSPSRGCSAPSVQFYFEQEINISIFVGIPVLLSVGQISVLYFPQIPTNGSIV